MRITLLLVCFFLAYQTQAQSQSDSLRTHVTYLCHYADERNWHSTEIIHDAAQYIKDGFDRYTTHSYYQRYEISGEVHRNILASFGPEQAKRIVIGAHYDAKGGGADDNASGVAALMEMARLLQAVDSQLLFRIDLVAWAGGELPSDKPKNMGSYKHALAMQDAALPVVGVIDIESIGYYSDSVRSQHFPFFIYRDVYGNRADFTAIYERLGMGSFGMMMKYLFRQYSKTKWITFKPFFPFRKIETNDFKNFNRFDIPCLLITDTGKFRNKNLHTTFDSPETLNYDRMRLVVDMVYQSVLRYRE
jgi:hypothetical protein